jgi:predicted metal-dependent HD superfamily phosphohydrolase
MAEKRQADRVERENPIYYDFFKNGNERTLAIVDKFWPTELQTAIRDSVAETLDETEIPKADFETLKNEILAEMEKTQNPYHNRVHAEEVAARIEQLAEKAGICTADQQILSLAALAHDLDHPGEKTEKASNGEIVHEEIAARRIAELLQGKISDLKIVAIQRLVLATRRWQEDATDLTWLERLIIDADLGGFGKSFEEFIQDSINVARERGDTRENNEAYLNDKEWLFNLQRLFVRKFRFKTREGSTLWESSRKRKSAEINAQFLRIDQQNPPEITPDTSPTKEPLIPTS